MRGKDRGRTSHTKVEFLSCIHVSYLLDGDRGERPQGTPVLVHSKRPADVYILLLLSLAGAVCWMALYDYEVDDVES